MLDGQGDDRRIQVDGGHPAGCSDGPDQRRQCASASCTGIEDRVAVTQRQ